MTDLSTRDGGVATGAGDRSRPRAALPALCATQIVSWGIVYSATPPSPSYDLFALNGSRWAFFRGEVCGKGPKAAAVTLLTRYTLRAAALHDPDPVTALTTLNTVLHERCTGGDPRYCTAIFGILTRDP